MARRDDGYLKQGILQGIGGWNGSEADRQQAELNQKDADEWNKNYSLMQEAARMRPDVSLGFSLGRLLFNNADKWFGGKGGRGSDGTKHQTAAEAASTTETPSTGAYDFSGFQTSDPLQALANAGDIHAQFAQDAEQNQPSLIQPGQFGTDEYAQQNGISLQRNTFNPNTQEATSTTLSTNNPDLLTGGQTFNPQQYGIQDSLINASGLNGDGYFGSMLGGNPSLEGAAEGLSDIDWKRFMNFGW